MSFVGVDVFADPSGFCSREVFPAIVLFAQALHARALGRLGNVLFRATFDLDCPELSDLQESKTITLFLLFFPENKIKEEKKKKDEINTHSEELFFLKSRYLDLIGTKYFFGSLLSGC